MDRKFLLIQLRFPLPEILFHLPETRNRYWQYPSSINHITRSSLWPSVVGARRWHGFDIGIQYGSRNNTDPLLRLLCKMAGSSWSISSHKSQHEGFLCMHGNIYKLCAGDGMFCDRSERRQCQGYPIERDGCRATEATTTKTAWVVEPWQWQRTQQRNNKRQQRAKTTGNRQNNNNDTALVYLQDGQQLASWRPKVQSQYTGYTDVWAPDNTFHASIPLQAAQFPPAFILRSGELQEHGPHYVGTLGEIMVAYSIISNK